MPSEKKEAIEKRVLEAQKVVVSNFLYEWRRKHGLDYVLIVRNGPGDVFTRHSLEMDHRAEILEAIYQTVNRIVGLKTDDLGSISSDEMSRVLEECKDDPILKAAVGELKRRLDLLLDHISHLLELLPARQAFRETEKFNKELKKLVP